MDRVFPKQGRVVLFCGFDDAFPRRPYRAEGGHVRAVLAPEQDDVGVRLVQVLVERGKEESLLFFMLTTHRL